MPDGYLLSPGKLRQVDDLIAERAMSAAGPPARAPFRPLPGVLVKIIELMDEGSAIYDGMIVRCKSWSDSWDNQGTANVRIRHLAGLSLTVGDVYTATPAGTSDEASPADAGTIPLYVTGDGGGAGTGGGSIIRADAAGSTVTAFVQGDDGAGGLEDVGDAITVKKLTAPAREDFEVDGYYIAVQVGGQWYAETGPKTACFTLPDFSSPGVLNCTTDPPTIDWADRVSIRVIDRVCP